LAKRVEDLEYGPKGRNGDFAISASKLEKDSSKVLWQIFQLWFEMKATEGEKRTIWKKIKQAREKGEKISVDDFLGESDELRWKNLI